ncbi:hypothetical protein NDU88_002780 [Pleurodeles waltl]|uniref:Uncharacterized protein n=1 Tax=Pleurodeles waltl TaxID=8319 RepID=A0AAV7UX56_PLEWA|nr:hypothetical protein NDU88_002780 [Pleurodeles waltl]
MPRGTSAAHSPGGTSGASFPDQEVLCRVLRNAETLDGEGPFKAPGEEERQKTPPPQKQKMSEEPTAMLEEGKATQQSNFGGDDQEAARC